MTNAQFDKNLFFNVSIFVLLFKVRGGGKSNIHHILIG
jgi:hypothetical protein